MKSFPREVGWSWNEIPKRIFHFANYCGKRRREGEFHKRITMKCYVHVHLQLTYYELKLHLTNYLICTLRPLTRYSFIHSSIHIHLVFCYSDNFVLIIASKTIIKFLSDELICIFIWAHNGMYTSALSEHFFAKR